MDKIRRYTQSDYDQIYSWFCQHKIPAPRPSYLPTVGFICDDVAAGFIYLTDSAVCILDTFISNPESTEEKRDKVLNLISMHLIEYAKSASFELIICSTSNSSIKLRATNLGFKRVNDETCFAREL